MQDGLVEALSAGRRFQAKLSDEGAAQLVVDAQSMVPSAGAVQSNQVVLLQGLVQGALIAERR